MASSIDASTSGAGGVITTADNTGILQLKTAGTTAVTVDASQTVGINTTGRPAGVGGGDNGKLWVKQTTTGNYGISAIASATDSFISIANNGTTGVIGTSYGTTGSYMPLAFYTTDLERMRIDSSGKVIIGATTSVSGTRLSLVAATSGVDTNTSSITSTSGTRYHWTFQDGTSSTERGSITTNGSATAYNTTSDYRLKENILPMTGALDKVAQLKPVTYNWKVDGSNGQGFIAHELQAVVPDCVVGEKDAVEKYTDEEGNEQTRPKYQSVDTSFLVATLTAAIQEQQTIINDLKARVTALEAK